MIERDQIILDRLAQERFTVEKDTNDLESKLTKETEERGARHNDPKLPYFDENKDQMDSYLARFKIKNYAVSNKWFEDRWSRHLSSFFEKA